MSIKVQSGDTLAQIAQANNVSVADLVKANPQIKADQKLQPGWTLKLPGADVVAKKGDGFQAAAPKAAPKMNLSGNTDKAPAFTPGLNGPSWNGQSGDAAKTFTTPPGGKSQWGNYQIPSCTFPSFANLTKTQQAMLGENGAAKYEKLDPEQRACFLNITSALAKQGIDTSMLRVKDFNSDRIFLEPQGLDQLKAQLQKNPTEFPFDAPEAKFHPGMTDWGARQSTGHNSVQVGMGPAGGFIDIDRGNPKGDVVGLFTHIGEVLTPGKTNPFAIGKEFGEGQTSYKVH
ncbi:MAG: LysM domain-containing protein [Myxococcaceae bacterium]